MREGGRGRERAGEIETALRNTEASTGPERISERAGCKIGSNIQRARHDGTWQEKSVAHDRDRSRSEGTTRATIERRRNGTCRLEVTQKQEREEKVERSSGETDRMASQLNEDRSNESFRSSVTSEFSTESRNGGPCSGRLRNAPTRLDVVKQKETTTQQTSGRQQ